MVLVLLQVPVFQDLLFFPLSIHKAKPIFSGSDGFIEYALYSSIVQSFMLQKVWYNLHVLGLQCVSKAPAQSTDTNQPFSFQTYPTPGRSTEPLHAVHSFSLLYGNGNDVQIVTLLTEEESLFSALLLVTKFKVQKSPTSKHKIKINSGLCSKQLNATYV